ncbi:hypothetical protein BOSEA31B_11780 [Hyphomicrobiales bacterium]|nr:hypothetical protein BOSEA31B_11780 [Hyphomicrobiales bacterium]
MAGMPGFFDIDERLKRLSELGDQLEAYARAVDFEAFRPDLERALAYSTGAQWRSATLRSSSDVEDPGDPGGQRPIG